MPHATPHIEYSAYQERGRQLMLIFVNLAHH